MAEAALPRPCGGAWLNRQLEDLITAAVPATPEGGARALVLAGSMARDESSWLLDNGGAVLLGDAELLYVVGDRARWPGRREREAWQERLARGMQREGMRASVSITPVRERYLRRLPAHIFGYELRATGRVLWGAPRILEQIPNWRADQIPREDAWRLLANRLIELLPEATAAQPRGGVGAVYPWVKLYLDMATSYLLFAGAYAPSYAERARRLRGRKPAAGGREPGIAWAEFARQVERCTAWKLDPFGEVAALLRGDYRQTALRTAQALWQWELQQLTGSTEEGEGLWERWLRQQPRRTRARGWASAWRHYGAKRPYLWPRWLRLAGGATPRHRVYGAAANLLFGPAEGMAARLPLARAGGAHTPAELAAAIHDNYVRLVQATRT